MRADQIMTSRVITIGPDASIVEAARKMLRHRVSALPVVNAANEPIGLISEGDFIRRAEFGTQRRRGRWLGLLIGGARAATDFVHEHGRKVGQVMISNPRTIAEATPLEEIAHIMESEDVRQLPVLRGSRLVGIVTCFDLVRAAASFAGEVTEPTADDDGIRDKIIAAIEPESWAPCRLSVIVRNGAATLSGFVDNQPSRQAALVAAENVPGVRFVRNCLVVVPEPEDEFGGGDIASPQQEAATTDDEPL